MKQWQRHALTFVATICLGRWVPHPPNWTPVGAVAIVGSDTMGPWRTCVVVLLGVWLSDLVINNLMMSSDQMVWLTKGWLFLAVGYVAMIVSSHYVSQMVRGYPGVVVRATVASWLFFLLTNAGVWWGASMYPLTLNGLMMCYVAGLPFLTMAWVADVVFSVSLCWVLRRATLGRKKNGYSGDLRSPDPS